MPAIPPALGEWFALLSQPTVILIGVGLIVNQLNKRIDDLRSDLAKPDDRQREDMQELGKKVDELPLKIMEMLSKAPR